jgi:hypothetical protein
MAPVGNGPYEIAAHAKIHHFHQYENMKLWDYLIPSAVMLDSVS